MEPHGSPRDWVFMGSSRSHDALGAVGLGPPIAIGVHDGQANTSRSGYLSDFETFYEDEYPGTVRLAFLLTRSNEAAEDLTQEAFASIYHRHGTLESPGGYLRVTVVNLCNRWHRTNSRRERRLRLVHNVDRHGRPEPDYLRDVLESLPFRQRAVLVLRYWSGLSEAEIADVLGCRPGTVKSLASRGLTQLRKEVDR